MPPRISIGVPLIGCYPPKIPTINIYRNSHLNMIFNTFIRIAKFNIIL